MLKPKSLVGKELDSSKKTIEQSQIKNLSLATNFNLNFNQLSNHLPSFIYGNLINTSDIYKTLGINIKNILHSREQAFHTRLLKVGDTVHLRTFLKDAYEQQASANPIGFIVLESIATIDNEYVFYGERILAVRGGFSRGRQA